MYETDPEIVRGKLTLNTEDVRKKTAPNLYEKNGVRKKGAPRWGRTLDLWVMGSVLFHGAAEALPNWRKNTNKNRISTSTNEIFITYASERAC